MTAPPSRSTTPRSSVGRPARPEPHPAPGSRASAIGIGSAHMMVRIAQQSGLTAQRVLAGSGLSTDTLLDPDVFIDRAQEVAVARNLAANLTSSEDDEGMLGLRVAQQYRVTTYGVFGWGLMCAPTLREQIRFGGRFLDLSYALCDITAVWDEPDGRVRMRVDDSTVPDDIRPFFRNRSLGGIVTLLRDTIPWPGWLHSVNVTQDRPRGATHHERILQAPVHFSQQYDEVVVNSDRLDVRTPTANDLALALAQRQCEHLVAARRSTATVRERVQQRVLRSFPRVASISEVASAMHTSDRALRRWLTEEATSFSAILDATRRTLAADMLSSGIPPSKAAVQLGYANPASFNHAFQRWYGRCPREYMMLHSPLARRRYPHAARDFAAVGVPTTPSSDSHPTR
ncbi:transcriptional regulator, AraC family [Jatrophihabitans endophyticus]|uniref:Transcriptional regulator, AraC family n=1 Tax=Jatrophihabitans endophyticus TaxID=1206085 RepID=A0A1M5REF5_9ACTN|nr:AraC family transcriptional regulator [Jatrophihabitans endophyticus]SHH24715.1 transcriptional regulator, AraC family [Jatrophihabitans endophyticus]